MDGVAALLGRLLMQPTKYSAVVLKSYELPCLKQSEILQLCTFKSHYQPTVKVGTTVAVGGMIEGNEVEKNTDGHEVAVVKIRLWVAEAGK